MSIIDHTWNKYDIQPLNIVCFVLENGHFALENNISLAVGTMYLAGFLTADYIEGIALGQIKISWNSGSRDMQVPLSDTSQPGI